MKKMDNSSNFRAQMSFLVSVLLHGAAVFFLALGPMLLSSKKGDAESHTVDFSIETAQTAPSAAAVQTVVQPPPAQLAPAVEQPKPVAQPEVAVVKPAVVKAPIKKSAPKKIAIAKNTSPAPTQKIAPQEVLPAENSESPLEKSETKTVESSDVVVAQNELPEKDVEHKEVVKETEETKVETAPVEEKNEVEEATPVAADEEFNSEKPAKTPATNPVVDESTKAVEPAPLPPPVIKQAPVTTNSSAQPIAQAATPATNAASAGDASGNIAAASAASGVAVTQSYTGLKQMSGNKPPSYTHEMRMDKMQGAGQLVYYVGKDGSVSQLRVTRSTGYAELDKAAVDAFSKYKFVPGQDGFTVHDFEFSLKGPAISDASRLRTTMK
jgi:periplasmic protein TonB